MQIALGFVFMAVTGLGLSIFGRIDAISIYGIYGASTLITAFLLVKRYRSGQSQTIRRFLGRNLRQRFVLVIFPYFLATAIWSSYVGAHTADAGLHVFWSRWILSTGHLPDYSVVGPSVPTAIFVFGPHLFLAAISLMSGSPTTDLFWLPLLFLYLAILLAIQSIALQITKSETASTFASLFYVMSQVPAARILLGNLPDLMGYFLIAAVVSALVCDSRSRKVGLVIALVAPAIIVYYQYALLTLVTLLVFFGVTLLPRSSFAVLVKRSVRDYAGSWLPLAVGAGESLIFASQVSYLNRGSVELLRATRWTAIGILDYVTSLGNASLFSLGILGSVVILWRVGKRNTSYSRTPIALVLWVFALIVASWGPWFGLGVEPIRFVWHLVEPLSIAAGFFLAIVLDRVCGSTNRMIRAPGIMVNIVYSSERARLSATFTLFVVLLVSLVVVPSHTSLPGFTMSSSPFLSDDVFVGQWLATHSNIGSGIAVNSDADSSATWVQAYSLRPRFFYRADYTINVSAPVFSMVYRDMAQLYDDPDSPDSSAIVQKYNIAYVVVHRPEFSRFLQASKYVQVYTSPRGNATIFQPVS